MGVAAAARSLRRSAARLAMGRVSGSEGMRASRASTSGPYDLLIAATALEHGATLVTNNVREFARVPGLMVEDWLS